MAAGTSLLLVFIGGGIGASMRYLMEFGIVRIFPWDDGRPWSILMINLFGCLLLGLLAGWLGRHQQAAQWLSPLLVTGILGGFTTFSTFALQLAKLSLMGESKTGLLLALASVLGGYLLAASGYLATR